MKLTAQHVFDAVPVISTIIREQRKLPQKGAYRLARLHAKLLPEYTVIAQSRDAIITGYGHQEVVKKGENGEPDELSPLNSVPADKIAEFTAAWAELGKEELEVDVQPVPLEQLDLGDDVAGSIRADELIVLGELVRE